MIISVTKKETDSEHRFNPAAAVVCYLTLLHPVIIYYSLQHCVPNVVWYCVIAVAAARDGFSSVRLPFYYYYNITYYYIYIASRHSDVVDRFILVFRAVASLRSMDIAVQNLKYITRYFSIKISQILKLYSNIWKKL